MATDPVGKMVPNRRLKMTQEDIDRAEPADQYNCAIAETIKRTTPEARRVMVNKEQISYTVGEERIHFPTPEAAVEAVIKPLDTGGKPEPITLNLVSGTAVPVKRREGESAEKNLSYVRNYEKEVRAGTRQAPLSERVKRGEEIGTSRTWNRFVDQEKRPGNDQR